MQMPRTDILRSLLPPHIPHGIHVESMWIPPSIWNMFWVGSHSFWVLHSIWIPHGMVMECPNFTWNDGMSTWIPHGMRMDSIWIPHGFHMDSIHSIWIPHGLHPFHMDSTWTASIQYELS